MSLNLSGTITTGGVAQQLMGPVATKPYNGFVFQNTSANLMYLENSGQPATTASMQVAAGIMYQSEPGEAPNAGLSVYCATGASTFVCKVF